MADKVLHVVCYDITSNRLRARVSAHLEELGIRVQGSVFELWLTRDQALRLGARLGAMIDRSDSLRLYPVPRSGLRKAQSHGRGGPPNPGPDLIF